MQYTGGTYGGHDLTSWRNLAKDILSDDILPKETKRKQKNNYLFLFIEKSAKKVKRFATSVFSITLTFSFAKFTYSIALFEFIIYYFFFINKLIKLL